MRSHRWSSFTVASLSALAFALGGAGSAHGPRGGSHGSSGGSHGSGGGYYYDSVASNESVPSAAPQTRVAYLNVKVPVDAKVYLQNQPMTLTGAERRFI